MKIATKIKRLKTINKRTQQQPKPHSVSRQLLDPGQVVVVANVCKGDLLTAFLLVSARPY